MPTTPSRGPSGPMIKPGDTVLITDEVGPVSLTIERTVHSVTQPAHDLESPGINTTQGDFFAFDDYQIERKL